MKKLQLRALFGVISLLAALFLHSCMKDYDFKKMGGLRYTPTLAVPLIYTDISINDILTEDDKNENIQVGSDNFVTLVYEGNLLSLRADEVVAFPDQSFSNSQSLSAADTAVLNAAGTVTIPITVPVNFSVTGNSRVDSIFFKSGVLNVTINSTFQRNIQLAMTIPGAIKAGTALAMNFPIVYSPPGPMVSSNTANLDGYKFNMTQIAPGFNAFSINLSLTVTGNSPPVSPGEGFTISVEMIGMKFSKMFGYVDQQFLSPTPDTVEVDIFNNSLGAGTFTLADPKLHITLSNSFGVPILLNFNKLIGYNPFRSPAQTIDMTTGIPNPLPIPIPTISQVGQTLSNSITLDNITTSNGLSDAIDFAPTHVIYQMFSQTNPGGLPPPGNTNFVLDSSQFRIDLGLELPLYGTGIGFVLQDTLDNFQIEMVDNVEDFLLRTTVENGFPVDVAIQIYFADSNFTILDSLVTAADPSAQIILVAADVDGNGVVTTRGKKTTDVTMNRSRIERINTTKHCLVKVRGSTTGGGSKKVKIYTHYGIHVEMGVKAKLRATLMGKEKSE